MFPIQVYFILLIYPHIAGHSKQYARWVGSTESKQTNKTSIMQQIERMKTECQFDESGAVVFVQKARANPSVGSHR